MKTKLFKTKLLFISLILILLCGGCDSWCQNGGWFCEATPINELGTKKDIEDTKKVIEEKSAIIKKASKEIKKEAEKIDKKTSEVQRKTPQKTVSEISPYFMAIKKSSFTIIEDTTKINKAVEELSETQNLLDSAKKKVITTEESLGKVEKERDAAIIAKTKIEEERDAAMKEAIKWLVLASIVGAGALGVFGFMYRSRICLTLSTVCIVVMSIAIFIEAYFVYLVVAGGIILAALLFLLIYNIIIQKKAFKEVVDTVEVTQSNLSLDARRKLFGGVGETGIMDGLQSKRTMDMVQKEKKKMSNLWYYAKTKESKKK